MNVTFYGTRGSIPIPEKEFMLFGGNTSCVKITLNDGTVIIFDAGTGIRKLGDELLKSSYDKSKEINIVLSHTHWDHIQGFPFFAPAYFKDGKILIAICGVERESPGLEKIFGTQMQSEYFPVPLEKMGASFRFWQPDVNELTGPLGNKWEILKHDHPGGAYSYRFTEDDKTIVYCTDIEHGESINSEIIHLSRNADLLIHEAQYNNEELKSKRGWGHSSWEQAVEVAKAANVKNLAFFHHDPSHDDTYLLNLEKEVQKEFPTSFFARESMFLEI